MPQFSIAKYRFQRKGVLGQSIDKYPKTPALVTVGSSSWKGHAGPRGASGESSAPHSEQVDRLTVIMFVEAENVDSNRTLHSEWKKSK